MRAPHDKYIHILALSSSHTCLHRQVLSNPGRIGSILSICEIADHVDTALGSRHSDVEQIGRPVNPCTRAFFTLASSAAKDDEGHIGFPPLGGVDDSGLA